jgi:hypothetical protein
MVARLASMPHGYKSGLRNIRTKRLQVRVLRGPEVFVLSLSKLQLLVSCKQIGSIIGMMYSLRSLGRVRSSLLGKVRISELAETRDFPPELIPDTPATQSGLTKMALTRFDVVNLGLMA